MKTIKLTSAQALVKYFANQYIDIDGMEVQIFAGIFAIFGHGNVAGLGEALYHAQDSIPTYRAHNEQGMAHAAIAYAKANKRQRMMACTTTWPWCDKYGHCSCTGPRQSIAYAVSTRRYLC
jgi:3D-(3,5/4)-trihydroxycyclohexane-1,2-dione acylhydrolase (decyclizing)